MLFLGGSALTLYGAAYWNNNRPVPPPDPVALERAYEGGVGWLLQNRRRILAHPNPALWWMIGEAARISGDQRLGDLYVEFRAEYAAASPNNIWQVFLAPERHRNADIPPALYGQLAEYQQYFLYASTCSHNMADDPAISGQHDPGFCSTTAQLGRAACATHQLLGYRLALRNACPVPALDTSILRLQARIERQLRLDPRVTDVYVQRLLMLAESGARDRINPRWIARLVAAQMPDGGWANMQRVVELPGGGVIGLDSRGLALHGAASAFHTTAQAVWLMALLLEPAGAGPPN